MVFKVIFVVCVSFMLCSCRTTQHSSQVASEVTNNSAEEIADSVSDSLQSFTSIEAIIHVDSASFSPSDSVPVMLKKSPFFNMIGLTNLKGIDLKVKLEQNTSKLNVNTHHEAKAGNCSESYNEESNVKKKANNSFVWIIAFLFFFAIDVYIGFRIWRTK